MSDPADLDVSELGGAELLVPAATDGERELASAIERANAPLARALPSPDQQLLVDVSDAAGTRHSPAAARPDTMSILQAAAWAGAPVFRASPLDSAEDGPSSVVLSGAAQLRELLASGTAIRADGAHTWLPQSATLHDLLVRAWRRPVEAAAVIAHRSTTRPHQGGLVVQVLDGTVEVAGPIDRHLLDPGRVLVVGPGIDVELSATSDAVWCELTTTAFGPTQLVTELRRRAGYWPLLRADLPATGALPVRSWAGSVLDHPDALRDALLAVYDDGAHAGAWAWWDAQLTFSPSSTGWSSAASAGATIALPAPPAFLDDRLRSGVADGGTVLATSRSLVPLAAEELAELTALVDGTLPPAAASPRLGHVLDHLPGVRR